MKNPFRSLFLKIFIWFWLAMILINVALFAAVAITRPTPTGRSWRDLAQVGPNAQKAADIYEQGGPGALAALLQESEKGSRVNATFFDQNGRELSGQTVQPGTTELIQKSDKSNEIEFNFAGRNTLVSRPVVSSKGQRYTYVAHIPRQPFQMSLQTQGLRL